MDSLYGNWLYCCVGSFVSYCSFFLSAFCNMEFRYICWCCFCWFPCFYFNIPSYPLYAALIICCCCCVLAGFFFTFLCLSKAQLSAFWLMTCCCCSASASSSASAFFVDLNSIRNEWSCGDWLIDRQTEGRNDCRWDWNK